MIQLWNRIRNSLTWRIILLVAVVQFGTLVSFIAYQNWFLERTLYQIEFTERDAFEVFMNANLDLTLPESTNGIYVDVNFYGASPEPFEEFWQDILANNPNFWFYYDDKTTTKSLGRIPARSMNITDVFPQKLAATDSCLSLTENYERNNETIFTTFKKCPGDNYLAVQFGGMEKDYIPSKKFQRLYFYNSNTNFYLILGLLISLTLITPGIIYVLLKPMRRGAEIVSHISNGPHTQRIPDNILPTELTEFTEAINAALTKLEDGYTRERQFRDAMAHELRTPLTILRARLDDKLSAKALREHMVADIHKMQLLIDQLLKLAKVSVQASQSETLDLVKEVRASCAECGAAAIKAGLDIDFQFDPHSKVYVKANKTALRLAVCNVIYNAIHHSASTKPIKVSVRNSGAVIVQDYGKGLPAHLKDNLFEPFSGASKAKTKTSHGLGLAIVAQVMQYSEGRVTVASSKEDGTAFALHFKRVEQSNLIH